jgi:DNA polymerase elongation subunit (family B)
MQSWLYDRLVTMFTTITGELSLMMLIEKYELSGIHVISANTDGVTVKIKKTHIDIFNNERIGKIRKKLNALCKKISYVNVNFNIIEC